VNSNLNFPNDTKIGNFIKIKCLSQYFRAEVKLRTGGR
jgi:hypothetical protein